VCLACERQRNGLCRHCPHPIVGGPRSLYCASCRPIVHRRQMRAYAERNREKNRIRALEHVRGLTPEERARRNEYKRLYRLAHPDKVRAQKRRYVQRMRDRKTSAYITYHRRYNKKHGEFYKVLTKAKKAEKLRKIPPCTKCGRSTRWKPIDGQTGKPYEKCNRCCWPFERKQRQARRRRQLREARIAAAAKPRKIRPPAKPAVRVGLERLCLTPGCDTVLTHRKKICTKCQRDRVQKALEQLGPSSGKGRRTDLERSEAA
jgi:hypothetical protein